MDIVMVEAMATVMVGGMGTVNVEAMVIVMVGGMGIVMVMATTQDLMKVLPHQQYPTMATHTTTLIWKASEAYVIFQVVPCCQNIIML